jgi:hypothetical protein
MKLERMLICGLVNKLSVICYQKRFLRKVVNIEIQNEAD